MILSRDDRAMLYDVNRILGAVTELILVLRDCDDLPEPVTKALDELSREVTRAAVLARENCAP